MTDKLTRDRWMSEFCLLVAKEKDIDLTLLATVELAWFTSHETARLWWIYHDARTHERCAAACAMAQQKIDVVVNSTDWQAVNAIARGLG